MLSTIRTTLSEYHLGQYVMDSPGNDCLPLRFLFNLLFGSEELLCTWKYNVLFCAKVNIIVYRKEVRTFCAPQTLPAVGNELLIP